MENNSDLIFGLICYVGFAVLLGVFIALYYTVGKTRPKLKKFLSFSFFVLIFGVVIITLIFFPTVSEIKDKYKPLSKWQMYLFSFLLILSIFVLTVFFGEKDLDGSPTKAISFAGIAIGLSFALSYIKLFSLPQGGSITLASTLPLIIYSYMFGAKRGTLAGIIYGLLQFIQSPQIYEPMQVLLDYPVAFAGIGIAGIFKNILPNKKPVVQFILGASVSSVLRYISHFLSGYYVFSSWAMEGYTALSWSLVYNLYVIVELGIIILIGSIVFSSKQLVNELDRISK